MRELAIGAAVWQAFTRVCADEVGVEPRTVVAANQPQAEFSPGRRTAGSHGKRATGRT